MATFTYDMPESAPAKEKPHRDPTAWRGATATNNETGEVWIAEFDQQERKYMWREVTD
ncbi:hypothetical protein PBI_BEEBEE8_4 [Microbacterium phage BeeBee8]|uniref:Uncharacterized protein n=1 Tax=Microbacterium phage BeeBee8 TaxID=2126924 RepID=A0A2R3ZZD3_9CAUD|nr:hypothetical protein PBI_BEEBEE8_4 [Microbacterium phage BeeBee8]